MKRTGPRGPFAYKDKVQQMQDTIFALSSGSLPSGVALIRVSGPRVSDVIARVIRREVEPRYASLSSMFNVSGQPIDKGLALHFPAPHSFTGEDCLELHVHGGRAVVMAIFDTIKAIPDTRMAEPGEFTRRAFANGKIDLVEAEGLADLLSAETEMQRRLALEQARGGHSALYSLWADRITHARAMIEAELDFADEDDIPGSISESIWADLAFLAHEIEGHLAARKAGAIIRDGLKVVIFGAPNAGKSRLINRLAQRDVAIVTDLAGTTRDVLSVDLDIGGFAVCLFDTAGIRETTEPVEQEGIRRARLAAEEADLILHVIDLSAPQQGPLPPADVKTIRIGNKSDLVHQKSSVEVDVVISAASGEGLDELKEHIGAVLASATAVDSLAIPVRIRHVELLMDTLNALEAAVSSKSLGLDLRAEQLRIAANALGRITGKVDVEDLLAVIFSEFCVGK